MAKINNPRKQFRFTIQLTGLDGVLLEPYLVQEITHPEVNIEQDTHGDVNYDIKTAGKVSFGNATLSKILSANGKDSFFFNWLYETQMAGVGGLIPNDYKRNIIVTEFGPGSDTILDIWTWSGCFPTKINGQTNTRMESGNTIESIELSVDEVRKNAVT